MNIFYEPWTCQAGDQIIGNPMEEYQRRRSKMIVDCLLIEQEKDQ